jgi:hypothetical protein
MFSKIHLGNQIDHSCECACRFKILYIAYSFPQDVVKSSRTCIVVSMFSSLHFHAILPDKLLPEERISE